MKKLSQSESKVTSGRSQVSRIQQPSKIPRKKPSPASGPAQVAAPTRSGSENFDSIADDVVGEIIKNACLTVEDREQDTEDTEEEEEEDDIWPTNQEYNIERGKAAITECLSNR